MKDKSTITLKEASELSGYTPDYIGQLIRQGKLPGKQVFSSVSWVTTEDAILDYVKNVKGGLSEDGLSKGKLTPEFLSSIYILSNWVLIGVLGLTALFLFFLFSVTADHYISARVETVHYAGD